MILMHSAARPQKGSKQHSGDDAVSTSERQKARLHLDSHVLICDGDLQRCKYSTAWCAV